MANEIGLLNNLVCHMRGAAGTERPLVEQVTNVLQLKYPVCIDSKISAPEEGEEEFDSEFAAQLGVRGAPALRKPRKSINSRMVI